MGGNRESRIRNNPFTEPGGDVAAGEAGEAEAGAEDGAEAEEAKAAAEVRAGQRVALASRGRGSGH